MCRDNGVVFYFVMLYPLCWVQLEKSRLVYMYSSKGYNQITSPYFPWRYTTLFCLSIAAFFFVFFPLLLSLFFLFLLLSTTLYSYKSLQKTASAPFGATLILSWLLLCVSLGFFFLRGSPTLWFQCKLLPFLKYPQYLNCIKKVAFFQRTRIQVKWPIWLLLKTFWVLRELFSTTVKLPAFVPIVEWPTFSKWIRGTFWGLRF